MQKLKFNITNTGTNHPLNSDTLSFVKDIIKECNYEVEISKKPKKGFINLIPEGFNFFNYKEFIKVKKDYCWGLIRTELYVNNSNILLNGSYNLWNTSRKIFRKENTTIELKFLNFIYNFKKRRLLNFIKYKKINNFLNKKKSLKNFIQNKYFLIYLILKKKISFSLFLIKFLHIENIYYDFIKSPHEVNHFNDSWFYKIFSINTHWKDLFMNTYKEIDNFDLIFSLGLDGGIPQFKNEKQILLPVIYLESYKNNSSNKLFNKKIDKEYDIFFSGLMTEYRREIYEELKKHFKVKFVSFVEDENERLLLNQKSKISIYIKKEKDQSIYSVMRYTYALQNNIPTLFESDKYCVPKYFESIAYTFKKEDMINSFKKIIENYDEFLLEYDAKINFLKQKFTKSKIIEIKNQLNKLENPKFF